MADISTPFTNIAIVFLLYLIFDKLCAIAAFLGVKDEDDDPEEGSDQPAEPVAEQKPVDGMLH